MVAPYNYGIQAPSAFESLVSGLKLGTSMQEMQAQQQLREAQALQIQQKMEAEKLRRERMSELNRLAPNQLSSRLPEFSDVLSPEMFNALANFGKTADEKTTRTQAGQLGQLVMAAGSESPDVLESVAQQLMAATQDEAAKKAIRTNLELAKQNPRGFVNTQLILLRALGKPGEDVANSIIEQLSLKPGASDELRLKTANADRAIAEAKTSQATANTAEERAAADLRLSKANAEKAAIEASYSERQQTADLEKKAKDLGLTAAQTRQALAATNKLTYEGRKLAIEAAALEASGGADPAKKFDQEEKLRKEFTARTKLFNEVDSTFSNLQSSANAGTGPGDIALITGFMKMLDPGSVVRETEFATARDTAGLFTRLENSLTKLQNGEFLKPSQRQEYVNLAKQYYDAAKKKADQEKKSIGYVVKNYRLNPDNVFGAEPEAPPPTAPAAAAPAQPAPVRQGVPTSRSVDDLVNQYRSR